MKTCTTCYLEQEISAFNKHAGHSDGLSSQCKLCIKAANARFRAENSESLRKMKAEYYLKNRDRLLTKQDKYYENNKEAALSRQKEYYYNNWEVMRERNKMQQVKHKQKRKKYRNDNREQINLSHRRYVESRNWLDVSFKINRSLRSRLTSAIKGGYKAGSAVKDLGCSIDDFKIYMEKQFKSGMSWENWGSGENDWQIDHIMPLAAFDLTNRQHVLLACHHGNLQPLWSRENYRKNDKVTLSWAA